ncbi:MAG: SufE family protein [Candidatus Kapabacteria bacterium]|jgi:cysteine desulfuration protein SufE|nr:SufE family protein [Candidatus Kapabacteria bacterium]
MSPSAAINQLADDFALFSDWEDKYAYIIDLGKHLRPYPEQYRTDEFKVRGCQSQVWLHPHVEGNTVHFDADSDAVIVRGLIALLMRVYDGATAKEILDTPTDFVRTLGLADHLSQNRANGLAAMLKQIHLYALAVQSRLESASS